jgi:hypothetical protein
MQRGQKANNQQKSGKDLMQRGPKANNQQKIK